MRDFAKRVDEKPPWGPWIPREGLVPLGVTRQQEDLGDDMKGTYTGFLVP